MKKIKLTAIFISLFFAGQAQMKNFIDQPYIEVAGNADTLVTPDEIYISIEISEKDTKTKHLWKNWNENVRCLKSDGN